MLLCPSQTPPFLTHIWSPLPQEVLFDEQVKTSGREANSSSICSLPPNQMSICILCQLFLAFPPHVCPVKEAFLLSFKAWLQDDWITE